MRLDAAVGVMSAAPPMAPMYINPSGTGDESRPELFDRRISRRHTGTETDTDADTYTRR